MDTLERGDSVLSKSQPNLNGGREMNVADLSDDGSLALCEYFEGPESQHKQSWLPVTDLNLFRKAQGGFRNAGEAP